MKRYLITTADERSWVFDRPVLLLGEWCRRYDRRHIWAEMDAVVAEPFGVEPGQKWHDLDRVQALARTLLGELTEALNSFHAAEHSERYWNIVIGHWLQRYVATVFNRYHALNQALSRYEIDGTSVMEGRACALATPDSQSFIHACNNDEWNHLLYSRLLCDDGTVELTPVGSTTQARAWAPRSFQQVGHRRGMRDIGVSVVGRAAETFVRKGDAFILSSYLPRVQEIKLQAVLGQMPQVWASPVFERAQPDPHQRERFTLPFRRFSGFECYVRQALPEMIPTCFLEGYRSLLAAADAVRWPRTPKFIFTSNAFDTDDVFKVWTAAKTENGIPYFTGQHGNNYGTLLGTPNYPERTAADRFFTWGWTDDSGKTVPSFVFPTVGGKPGEFDPAGGLLLTELYLPHRLAPWDNYYEYGLYQEDQFEFVEKLPAHVQSRLTVRLHSAHRNVLWFDEQRWADRRPGTRVDTGDESIRALTSRSRLVVNSYDSTGMLENLALNIPTICFWRGGLTHLLPSAKPYYQLLRDVRIIFDTPGDAAAHIAKHWDDIGAWWHSGDVQTARRAFAEVYARTSPTPIAELKDALQLNAREHRRQQSPLSRRGAA